MSDVQYRNYSEIPPLVSEYILTVAHKKHIMSISLEEINSFLNDLHTYYKSQDEKETDEWAT